MYFTQSEGPQHCEGVNVNRVTGGFHLKVSPTYSLQLNGPRCTEYNVLKCTTYSLQLNGLRCTKYSLQLKVPRCGVRYPDHRLLPEERRDDRCSQLTLSHPTLDVKLSHYRKPYVHLISFVPMVIRHAEVPTNSNISLLF